MRERQFIHRLSFSSENELSFTPPSNMITGRKTGIMITEIKSCKILKLFNLPIMMKEY